MLERELQKKLVIPKLARPIDKWLMSEDTWLARGLKIISPLEGAGYRVSKVKRRADFTLALAISTAAAIPAGIILFASSLQKPLGHPFYSQERVKDRNRNINIIKFRTMPPGSDADLIGAMQKTRSFAPEKDPRVNGVGKIIRAYELDELPQLLQVIKGDIALVDIRSAAPYVFDNIKKNRPELYQEWEPAVFEGPTGLDSANSAFNAVNRKDDLLRLHYDIWYARKASLGLDLFILWRTGIRMAAKVEEKVRGLDTGSTI